jgi:hypothetical protein
MGSIDSLFKFSKKKRGLEQYITKLTDGCCYTARSFGETDRRLICIDMYDVKDIVGVDKCHWWKKARVRCQFLSASRKDAKLRMVEKLCDMAADEMKKKPNLTIDVRDAM